MQPDKILRSREVSVRQCILQSLNTTGNRGRLLGLELVEIELTRLGYWLCCFAGCLTDSFTDHLKLGGSRLLRFFLHERISVSSLSVSFGIFTFTHWAISFCLPVYVHDVPNDNTASSKPL